MYTRFNGLQLNVQAGNEWTEGSKHTLAGAVGLSSGDIRVSALSPAPCAVDVVNDKTEESIKEVAIAMGSLKSAGTRPG